MVERVGVVGVVGGVGGVRVGGGVRISVVHDRELGIGLSLALSDVDNTSALSVVFALGSVLGNIELVAVVREGLDGHGHHVVGHDIVSQGHASRVAPRLHAISGGDGVVVEPLGLGHGHGSKGEDLRQKNYQ